MDERTIDTLARLARLDLDSGERASLSRDLGRLLEHFRSIQDEAPSGAPDALPADAPLRPDASRPAPERDDVLANAPALEAGAFKVPRVIE